MRDAMTVITAIVLAICGLTYWAEARADYVLQIVRNDQTIVTVDRYEGDDDTQCLRDYFAWMRGAKKYPEVADSHAGGCIPCDEFPSQCQEGI